jgi:hypothetical protein
MICVWQEDTHNGSFCAKPLKIHQAAEAGKAVQGVSGLSLHF